MLHCRTRIEWRAIKNFHTDLCRVSIVLLPSILLASYFLFFFSLFIASSSKLSLWCRKWHWFLESVKIIIEFLLSAERKEESIMWFVFFFVFLLLAVALLVLLMMILLLIRVCMFRGHHVHIPRINRNQKKAIISQPSKVIVCWIRSESGVRSLTFVQQVTTHTHTPLIRKGIAIHFNGKLICRQHWKQYVKIPFH